MVTGFLTFVLWLIVMSKVVDYYLKKRSSLTFLEVVMVAIGIVAFTGALIWLYKCHWDWLAVCFFVLFFIYWAIKGLFG